MANLVLVLGKTTSGKSRSIINLPPEKTYIINCLGKDLPFKGARALYNRQRTNINDTKDYKTVIRALNKLPELKPEVNTVIIDDARHIMESEYLARATEVGYTKFTQLGQHMIEVFEAAKAMPDTIDVFIMLHTDDVTNGQDIVSMKAKLVGSLVENHFDPMEIATICLITYVQIYEGSTSYKFATNKQNIAGVDYPAKSPEGMFEDLLIDNDLLFVKETIHKYYY